jgi:hypothetical protein
MLRTRIRGVMTDVGLALLVSFNPQTLTGYHVVSAAPHLQIHAKKKTRKGKKNMENISRKNSSDQF